MPMTRADKQRQWSLHVETWKHCDRCPAHKTRTSEGVCIGRGSPRDSPEDSNLYIIGGAPDEDDEIYESPFSGRMGVWLDDQLNEILPTALQRYYATIVGCIPRTDNGEHMRGGPDKDMLRVCRPRISDLIALARPKVILCLGKLAEKEVDPTSAGTVVVPEGTRIVYAAHPNQILYSSAAQRGYLENVFGLQLLEVAALLNEETDRAADKTTRG